MDSSDIFVLTPPGSPDPSLAIAAVRAGARGTLDLEYARPETIRAAVQRLARHGRGPFGVKLGRDAATVLPLLIDANRPAWVFLAGGLEQGVVLPSLSWLVGLRTREGAEFGIGPNVTPAGVSLVLAAGVTMRTGTFNVPVNVAVVPSRVGTRVSVLTGFNMRR